MKQYEGTASWDSEPADLKHIVFTTDRIAFDLTHSGYSYRVHLRPDPDGPELWKGTWTANDGSSGHVEVETFRSRRGDVVLAGRWVESGNDYRWFVEIGED